MLINLCLKSSITSNCQLKAMELFMGEIVKQLRKLLLTNDNE